VLPEYQYYKAISHWHAYYKSDVIRTGPREVNVYSIDAIPLIHGANAKCIKSLWYIGGNAVGGKSVLNIRDKAEHRVRRKAWDHAFNAKALREYEPRLNRHARGLMAQLKEQAQVSESVRITNWVNYYSFDVVGDVGFNRSFGMVEKGEEDESIRLLHQSMAPLSVFTHLPWAFDLITRTAVGVKPLHAMIDWASGVLGERAKV
jgi:cytochrome P450